MAHTRVYWVAISWSGQFPLTPHTYTWLEKNTGIEEGYCTLSEMAPSQWKLATEAKLWKAEGWLSVENDVEATAIVLHDFLKKLPSDRELMLLFTMDSGFTSDSTTYPLIVQTLFVQMSVDTKSILESMTIQEMHAGMKGLVGQTFKLSGRGCLTTEAARARVVADLLATEQIACYIRRPKRNAARNSLGTLSTNT